MESDADPGLLRAFAQAHEPLANDDFCEALRRRTGRARRARRARRALLAAAIAALALANAHALLAQAAPLVRWGGDAASGALATLLSPWGWAASMIAGLGIVLHARPSRR